MKLTLINCSVVEAEGGGTLAKGMNQTETSEKTVYHGK